MTRSPDLPEFPRRPAPSERQTLSQEQSESAGKGRDGDGAQWKGLTRRLSRIADDLEKIVQALPASTPTPAEAKKLRRASGQISQHTGTLKRRLT